MTTDARAEAERSAAALSEYSHLSQRTCRGQSLSRLVSTWPQAQSIANTWASTGACKGEVFLWNSPTCSLPRHIEW